MVRSIVAAVQELAGITQVLMLFVTFTWKSGLRWKCK